MIAMAAASAEVLACLGFGIAAMRGLGILAGPPSVERLGVAFALGFGVLGWIVAFLGWAGMVDGFAMWSVLGLGMAGWLYYPREASPQSPASALSGVEWLVIAGIVLAAGCDFIEALAPPTDADTLAYHFALPKMFAEEGRVQFVPRAIDGAIPLLVQMTYLPAYVLGGERALTMWAGISGWWLAPLAYALARRYLSRDWSLMTVLILMTTPAILYGAGTGQVETRIALFTALAAIAVLDFCAGRDPRQAVVVGLAAGFFAASKFTGLFFVVAAGCALIAAGGRLRALMGFAVAGAVAGFQWYAWNFMHSGDPVFPLLFGILPGADTGFWNQAHHDAFKQAFFGVERAFAINPVNFLLYPFAATLLPPGALEAGRTGFGPAVLLMMPFVVAGGWKWRRRLRDHPLAALAVMVIVFYALWFFIGSSQRVRHLLVIYPVLLVGCAAVGVAWGRRAGVGAPLCGAALLSVGLQLAGQGLAALKPVVYTFSDQSRDAYLMENVSFYDPVPWINSHLHARDRIFVFDRELNYTLDIPYFHGHKLDQTLVDVLPPKSDLKTFYTQLRRVGVTHLLVRGWYEKTDDYFGMSWRLVDQGCARLLKAFNTQRVNSRTLPAMGGAKAKAAVLRLTPRTCRFSASYPAPGHRGARD